jgi:benzoate-CoA ligase
LKATIFDYFAEQVSVRPDRVAYLYGDRTITFSEIDRRAGKCRSALRALGIGPGDRIALAMSDSPDMVVALLAVMGLGAIAVPLSTIANSDELAHMLSDPQPRCVIVSTDKLASFVAARRTSAPTVLVMGPSAPGGWTDLSAATNEALPIEPMSLDPEAVAVILYTSGTTGYPKGAVHRHRDIPYIVEATGRGLYGIGPDDRIFSSARMFFSFGFSNSFSVPLALGATCILTSVRPTPQVIADVFSRYHPTVFFSVPAIFRALLEHHRAAGHLVDTTGLRFSASGGEKLAPQIFREWKALTGTDILDVIGTTEVMYGFISNRPGRIKFGSSGLPIPGYEVKLVDDSGAIIAKTGRGHLFVRGGSISSSYWNKPEEVLQNGWLKTGDIYRRDNEGFYFFEGRSDDLFKSSGMWVSPTEVEDALCGHPAVLEAAVVSLPDHDGGFTSVAHVALRAGWGKDDATAHAIAAHAASVLQRHKRPRAVCFVDAIPRTATGKIQRFKLRESFVAPEPGCEVP